MTVRDPGEYLRFDTTVATVDPALFTIFTVTFDWRVRLNRVVMAVRRPLPLPEYFSDAFMLPSVPSTVRLRFMVVGAEPSAGVSVVVTT